MTDSMIPGSLESTSSWAYGEPPRKHSRLPVLILSLQNKDHSSPREASCLVQKLGSQVNLILQGEPGSVLQLVSSSRCIWNTI